MLLFKFESGGSARAVLTGNLYSATVPVSLNRKQNVVLIKGFNVFRAVDARSPLYELLDWKGGYRAGIGSWVPNTRPLVVVMGVVDKLQQAILILGDIATQEIRLALFFHFLYSIVSLLFA